jgi:acetoin utilization protein AcuB
LNVTGCGLIYWASAGGNFMIVSEVMTTKLVTVTADDTLSHAANLLRQYQFHHLPVVRTSDAIETPGVDQASRKTLLLEGLLTSQDIELAATLGTWSSSEVLHRPWQERQVVEVMHRATVRVSPNTSVAAAAQILVERGLNCLPVVEYERTGEASQEQGSEDETQAVLVGLLTRSDLLMALARSLGAFEPGMQLTVQLPLGDLTPLARTLLLAAELHIHVRSVMAAPLQAGIPLEATVRLGTIHPTPLLARLQEEHIEYTFSGMQREGDKHV